MTTNKETTVTITVWGKGEQFCGQCKATKNSLDNKGVPYQTKDITAEEHAERLAQFKAQGLNQAPIVQTPTETWAGFRPDMIDKAAAEYHATQQAAAGPTVGGPGLS